MALRGDAHYAALLKQGSKTPAADLQNLIQERHLSWDQFKSPIYADQLVQAYLAQNDVKNLPIMIQLQEQALAGQPANPYGWMRLAMLYYQRDGAGPKAVMALHHSLATGPSEARLLVPRATLGVLLENVGGADLKAKLPDMLRAAWNYDADSLAKAAWKNNYTGLVTAALKDEPQKLAAFHKKLGQRP